MKSVVAIIFSASLALAQQELSDLAECGQTCISNMINIANEEFGCESGDVLCYCTHPDFGFGIRDCANEACPQENAADVINYGTEYCANAVSAATESVSALSILSTASATDAPTSTPTPNESEDADDEDNDVAVIVPIATGVVSSVSEDVSSVTEEIVSTVTEEVSSVVTSVRNALTSITGSVASEIATETSEARAPAAMATSGPLLGAAGLAALLFL